MPDPALSRITRDELLRKGRSLLQQMRDYAHFLRDEYQGDFSGQVYVMAEHLREELTAFTARNTTPRTAVKPRLTAAQVYYITHVYPEHCTPEEVQGPYETEITTEEDRQYWETAARTIEAILQQNP